MKKRLLGAACASALVQGAQGMAQERLELEGATIIGNRELPKVLYIIPWKSPPQDHGVLQTGTRFLGEKPVPLDRDGFLRQLKFKERMPNQHQSRTSGVDDGSL